MTKSPSSDPRLIISVLGAKVTGTIIRAIGKGGGTAVPGLVAERIDPGLLAKLSKQLSHGAVLVTGTNGKTTTSRMIADLAADSGWKTVHNRAGANMQRGIVASFVEGATSSGRMDADVAVFETDEGALPEVAKRILPRVILLNNLYRDQEDRYGNADVIASKWRSALQQLPDTTTVVVNGDDPRLVAITDGLALKCVYFGLTDHQNQLEGLPASADAVPCSECGAALGYRARYLTHLGDWFCPVCGWQRPDLDIAFSAIALNSDVDLAATAHDDSGDHSLEIGVPGLYNAYNALAAITIARELGAEWGSITASMAQFRSAFGRMERFQHKGRSFTMILVKNPAGFNEVFRMITSAHGVLEQPTLIGVNNLPPDGEDIGWFQDVDFEQLAAGDAHIYTTGMCTHDLGLRLEGAGIPHVRIHELGDNAADSAVFEAFVDAVPEGTAAYILPNYTVMQQLRKSLADRGVLQQFWEE